MSRGFDELVAEAESASVDGWDFSWLDGRATEQRPSWGYQWLMGERLGRAGAALDIQTGGGEVLAAAPSLPPVMAATESWPPNIAKATALLRPRGVVVVADPDEPPLPFADSAFDLVTSRHPATVWWTEIARVLEPGGTYFAQHVGHASVFELVEYFLGPQPQARRGRYHEDETADAIAAGLTVVDLRFEPAHGILRHRRRCLLLTQGDLDGSGIHRRAVSGPAPRTRSADPSRRIFCRPLESIPDRGTQELSAPRRAAHPERDRCC